MVLRVYFFFHTYSDSNKLSQCRSASLALDPPPMHGPKLSKVSYPKMAVAGRQLQSLEEEELDSQVLSDIEATDLASSSQEMISNINNSTASPYTPLLVTSSYSYELPTQVEYSKCQGNDMEGN